MSIVTRFLKSKVWILAVLVLSLAACGGGGGGALGGSTSASNGGSGVVIIRYKFQN